MKVAESSVEVHEQKPGTQERDRKMRELLEELLARKPVALLIMAELGDEKLATVAVGSYLDVMALAQVVPELVENVLRQIPRAGDNQ